MLSARTAVRDASESSCESWTMEKEDTARTEAFREAPREKANVVASKGIYESVLVASFGGVHYLMSKTGDIGVHPFVLLLSCLPVFSAQLSALYALRMGLDFSKPFYREEDEADEMLLGVKLLMAAIVGLINFQRLFSSVCLMLSALNPHFWVETCTDRDVSMITGRLHRIEFFALCSCSASMMSMFVCYTVCMDSISIILGSDSVKDAIFDCMALSFLQDLDEYWWQLLRRVFHLSPLDGFTFEVEDPSRTYTEQGYLTPEKKTLFLFPRCVGLFLRSTPCLGRGSHCTEVVALSLLFWLYGRQLFSVLLAVDSGVLPAARDVCFQYHMIGSHFFVLEFTAAWLKVLDAFLLIKVHNRVEELAQRSLDGCQGDQGRSITIQDEADLFRRYTLPCVVSMGIFGVVLLAPKLVQAVWSRKRTTYEDMSSWNDGEYKQDLGTLQRDLGTLHRRHNFSDLRLRRLEETLEALVLERNRAFGGMTGQGRRGWY